MMTEFILRLTPADLSVINEGLQEVKLRLAAPLVDKINAQIRAQTENTNNQDRPPDEPG